MRKLKCALAFVLCSSLWAVTPEEATRQLLVCVSDASPSEDEIVELLKQGASVRDFSERDLSAAILALANWFGAKVHRASLLHDERALRQAIAEIKQLPSEYDSDRRTILSMSLFLTACVPAFNAILIDEEGADIGYAIGSMGTHALNSLSNVPKVDALVEVNGCLIAEAKQRGALPAGALGEIEFLQSALPEIARDCYAKAHGT